MPDARGHDAAPEDLDEVRDPAAPARTVAIVGLGLIGLSVAQAVRRRWPAIRLVGVDRGSTLLQSAVVDALDVATSNLDAVRDADAIVLATPVEAVIETIGHLAGRVRSDALIMDTASTKRAVLTAARVAGLSGFVGGHPMAGGTAAGPGAARANLFEAQMWLLVAQHGSNQSAVARARALVEGLGAVPVLLEDARAHDQIMAAVSHLPQLVASALMVRVGAAVGEAGLRLGGAGLRDTTRLAASQAAMWEGVLATNADEIGPLLRALADDLQVIAGQLEDPAAVRELFTAANRVKAAEVG